MCAQSFRPGWQQQLARCDLADLFLKLSKKDRKDALLTAVDKIGRPAHILEKDFWVVWAVEALFRCAHASELTFKGGTSLSKAYKAIDRFSEDVDLVYDIRKLIEPPGSTNTGIPKSRSQRERWESDIRPKVHKLVDEQFLKVIGDRIKEDDLSNEITVRVHPDNPMELQIAYATNGEAPATFSSVVLLQFGGKATGEPNGPMKISCDMAEHFPDLLFPEVDATIAKIEMTFWEKIAACHVFCRTDGHNKSNKPSADKYARHWSDLISIKAHSKYEDIRVAHDVTNDVVAHQKMFHAVKTAKGELIDFEEISSGAIQLVPTGEAHRILRADYEKMRANGFFYKAPISFDDLMKECEQLQSELNDALKARSVPKLG